MPGVVEGWSQMLSRFGTSPLSRCCSRPSGTRAKASACTKIVAGDWAAAERLTRAIPRRRRRSCPAAMRRARRDLQNENLAKSLRFHREAGATATPSTRAIAQAITADMKSRDGSSSTSKHLAAHKADWWSHLHQLPRYDVLGDAATTQASWLEMLRT